MGDSIGVFDSGIGGLSVLRALRMELPQERFIYIADSAYAPYGERNDFQVLARAHAITTHLTQQHRIKALVVACNTATAAAIRELRQSYPDLPIVGIEPALKPAALQTRTRRIGVMATRGTLSSTKFSDLMQSLSDQATFILQPCDGLADAIEQGDAIKIEALCVSHTSAMGRFGHEPGAIDTMVLGCTHYPLISNTLADLLGVEIALLDGGAPVARQARRVLAEKGLLQGLSGSTEVSTEPFEFFATGQPNSLRNAVQRWFGEQTPVHVLDVPNLQAHA